jgi:hypothetical protein
MKSEYCKRSDVIDAFTWLVIDAYRPTPVHMCAEVRSDTQSYLENIGDDLTVMMKHFKVTKIREDFVTNKQLDEFIAIHNMCKETTYDRLVRMGARKDNNCHVQGQRHGRGFLGVKLVEDDELIIDDPSVIRGVKVIQDEHVHDTSSPLENRFRECLESLTGVSWVKARPAWLLNPLTGVAMELDMYYEPFGIAVEYNGSQHYEYPNAFHTSRSAFNAQVARDRTKRALCMSKGVRLVEIVSRSDLAIEVCSMRAQFEEFGVRVHSMVSRQHQ